LHLKRSPGSISKIISTSYRVNSSIVHLILWSEGEIVAIAEFGKQDRGGILGSAFLIWQ